jgi:hypothetical protein
MADDYTLSTDYTTGDYAHVNAGDGQTYDSFGNVVNEGSAAAASADPTGTAQQYLDWLSTAGSDASSGINLKSISDLLSGKGAGGTAGQLLGLGGIGSLLNSMLGGGGGYSGYKGSIPTYTAQRTMNAIPQTVAAPTAANPQAMATRRPGSGGITYFSPMQYLTPAQVAAQTAAATPAPAVAPAATEVVKVAGGGLMHGGIASLGGYSDGGQLLRGPGDGVSDSIPATIGGKQPARLADGEFVVPARIVSELGNGSTEAGARKLYEMMDRIKASRKKAKNIAADTKAAKHLPA